MNKKRPLSPHLSIYSPLITSASSIIGRMSGAFLYLITIIILIAVAFNIHKGRDVGNLLTFIMINMEENVLVYIFFLGLTLVSTFCMFFYNLAVLRHLIWDFGYCLDLKISKTLGYGMFILASIMAFSLTFYMFFI
jgi:succinate dehydrogenase / fumarate reductase cytochrome b subunit